jgi:IS605 OrfB family transposase
MLQTYQTKIRLTQLNNGLCSESYLEAFGKFFGVLERRLFHLLYLKKQSAASAKTSFCKTYQITARQYNSLRIQLEGKISSILEVRTLHIENLKQTICEIEKNIQHKTTHKEKLWKKISHMKQTNPSFIKSSKKYKNIKFVLHQKKRKLRNVQQKLIKLESDEQAQTVRICFGSKKLFHQQFHLQENGMKSHEEWKQKWEKARSSQFLVVGSKDETFGNQNCTYNVDNELRLRVAYQFEQEYGKYITFPQVTFPYGQAMLDQAKVSYIGHTKGGKQQKYFKAVTYRFLRKEKGWYLYATVDKEISPVRTTGLGGYIGIDLNTGFLSICEVDRYGNPLKEWKSVIPMYDRNQHQIEASLQDAVKHVLEYAQKVGKHVVIEQLNFNKKKASLGEVSKKSARMLSGFAYSKFKSILESKAKKLGVGLKKVNPAYTSQMGQMKYMPRYGLSSHGSAACMIARKAFYFRMEQPKYDSVLQFPKTFNKEKSNYSNWVSIIKSTKKNYLFRDKVELLKADI